MYDIATIHNKDYINAVEPGEFSIMIGSSLWNMHLQQVINVNGIEMKQVNRISPGKQQEKDTVSETHKVTISGIIRDVQSTVIFDAWVKVKNQRVFVCADKNGKYSIGVNIGDPLIFTAGHFKTKALKVTGETNINLT